MRFICLLLAATLSCAVYGDAIDNIAAHQWYEVPNTHLSTLDPCPAKNCAWSGNTGQSSVILAWCGGAFDTKRDKLIIWGGGHTDYAGNEVYTFSLNTLQWRRETEPAADVTILVGEYPATNGKIQPISRHTYDYITYLPNLDRFCSFGYAAPYRDGGPDGGRVHCFNMDSLKWERKSSSPAYGLGALSAYDPVTGHGWCKGTDKSFLAEYFPDSGIAGTWVKRTTDSVDFLKKYILTMDIDPVARKLVAVGGGEVWQWDISNPRNGVSQTEISTSGANSIVSVTNPGLAYDPVTGNILAWGGGQTIYSLDVPSKTWTSTSATGANPGSAEPHGTDGRFRYSSAHNVFVVVNSTGSNVFIYRHTPGLNATEARALFTRENALKIAPNPWSPENKITVELTQAADVSLSVFDATGRMVRSLKQGRLNAGVHNFSWNATNEKGVRVTGGIYFCRLTAAGRIITKKSILAR